MGKLKGYGIVLGIVMLLTICMVFGGKYHKVLNRGYGYTYTTRLVLSLMGK